MALNPRYEISPGSADGVSFGYQTTQRSHFPAGGQNLERGSSFRESHDSRATMQGTGGASFSGGGSSGHGELQSLSQVLSLDLIPSGEQKYARQMELRRATVAAMGVQSEVHGNLQPKLLEQQSAEELKRIKVSLSDNAARARERSRALSEAILKLEKYRASSQPRKRARTEAFVHERPMTPLSVERAAGNSIKASFCASPSHVSIADSGTPKQEDKSKGAVPNKRVRTSMVDVRLDGRTNSSSFQRSSGMGDRDRDRDRDRDSFKSSASLIGLVEDKDRPISTSGEGWEKAKMKGRRSGPKSDSVVANSANASLEVEREHKWGAQHRNILDPRCRPSEGHGFRSGPVHGVMSMHKVESAQQSAVQIRQANRLEPDGSSSIGEKPDRPVLPEKERLLLKNGVKLPTKDEGPLQSSTAFSKAKSARGPRSSTGVLINSSVHASRPPAPDLWDRTPGRPQVPVVPTNRNKRPAPSRPTSPPAQWGGQRPQKMARIRRVNLVPPVGPIANLDDVVTAGEGNPARDNNVTTTTVGTRPNPSISTSTDLVKKVGNNAPSISQSKLKSERATNSAGVSESDDSEGGDVKSKEKWKKHGDAEGRFGIASSQKMAPLVISGKKSRLVSKEEGGDGVKRQGRSSRGFVGVRESSLVTHIDKVDPLLNAKQLRSARSGLEKPEKPVDVLPCSKPGRPPSKKGTGDRKALTRPRRPIPNGSGDISGESDDDREDLFAAVQAAVNASAAACSNTFWKEMECFFAYLTPNDIESLRKQANELEEMEASLTLMVDNANSKKDVGVEAAPLGSLGVNSFSRVTSLANGSIEVDTPTKVMDKQQLRLDGRKNFLLGDKGIPLSQRLVAALIIEVDGSGREDETCWVDAHVRYGPSMQLHMEVKKGEVLELDMEAGRGNNNRKLNGWVKGSLQDGSYTSNGHRHWDQDPDFSNTQAKVDIRKEGDVHCNGPTCMDDGYQSLSLDDRIALELQSAGLFPDPSDFQAREDNEIAEQLQSFHVDLKDQVHVNRDRLLSLERVILKVRPAEERERERLAMSKLIEIAFAKRVGGRGSVVGVSGIKSSASKGARAAALSFAKRALARWRLFADTGESCFTDAALRNTLFCVLSESGELLTNTTVARDGANFVSSSKLNAAGLEQMALEGSGRPLLLTAGAEKADRESSESGQVATTSSDWIGDKGDVWSSRLKKKEVLLEDVGGSVGVCNSLGGPKGKRSERERDGKSQSKEGVGGSKGARQGLSMKGERKTKTKPRQKAGPQVKAVNGLFGKPLELSKDGTPGNPFERLMKLKDEPLSRGSDGTMEAPSEGEGALDLSHLQIPSMDDLGGQGQDLGSWLDFEDPGLADAGGDFMGLDVPMDDLADLAMMM